MWFEISKWMNRTNFVSILMFITWNERITYLKWLYYNFDRVQVISECSKSLSAAESKHVQPNANCLNKPLQTYVMLRIHYIRCVCVCVFFVLLLVSILFDFYTAVNKVYDSFVQLVCTVLSEYRAQRHFAVIAASI